MSIKGDKISNTKRIKKEDVISRSNNVYGIGTYEYLNLEYKNMHSIIDIKCNKHNEIFHQEINSHLRGYYGCKHCAKENKNIVSPPNKKTKDGFIKEHKEHQLSKYNIDYFNYNQVEYINNRTKMKIICPYHGDFYTYRKGFCCPDCKKEYNRKKNEEIFFARAVKKHSNYFDYSQVKFIDNKTHVKIICPKHGQFEQLPSKHIYNNGCEKCNISNGENLILQFLIDNGLKFEQQKRFKDCRDIKPLPFDFYLYKYNLCIEYDGQQHFESVEIFGGDTKFIDTKKKDKIKNQYCIDNNIGLIRISYRENIIDKLNCYPW